MFRAIRNFFAARFARRQPRSRGLKGVFEKVFRHRTGRKAIKGRGTSAKLARTSISAQQAKIGGGVLLAIAGLVGSVAGIRRLTAA